MIEPLTLPEILLRVGAAFITGGILGFERESHGRAAGFRTILLVCVAAALTMVISQALFTESGATSPSWRPDPARLAAGLLAGMGFLGAGTIVRHADIIRGVTTAATLWFVTILGIALGSGQFLVGFIGLAAAVIALVVFPYFESRMRVDVHATVTVTLRRDAFSDAQIKERIESFGLRIKQFELSHDLVSGQKTICCEVRTVGSTEFELSQKAIADLTLIPGVLQVRWA